jgi:BA14K-like protein
MLAPTSALARAGVVALGVLMGFGGTAMAAPLGRIEISVPSAGASLPLEAVRNRGGQMIWPRGGRAWGGGGRAFRGGNWNGNRMWRGGRNWNGNRAWRGNGNWKGRHWRGGHGHYRHYHDYDDDFGVVIGLGLPLFGLGYGGYYNGYYPGYYNGGYYPRRYYGSGSGHVQWCYSRYRSYRAWDNTYQPYHGPRRQCHSPYG